MVKSSKNWRKNNFERYGANFEILLSYLYLSDLDKNRNAFLKAFDSFFLIHCSSEKMFLTMRTSGLLRISRETISDQLWQMRSFVGSSFQFVATHRE